MKKHVLRTLLAVSTIALVTGCGKGNNDSISDNQVSVNEATNPETSVSGNGAGDEAENLLVNGDFSDDINGWGVYNESGGSATLSVVDGEGVFAIETLGVVEHANQLYYDGFDLQQGGVYEFSFDASSTIDRPVEVRLQINGGDYHAYAGEIIDIGSEMNTYSFTFTMDEATDPAPRLCFNLGKFSNFEQDEVHTVTIDNVSLVLTDGSGVTASGAGSDGLNVNVNQVGYLTNVAKTAKVRNHSEGEEFSLVDSKGNIVYTGKLENEISSEIVGETVCVADFSEVKDAGVYKVVVGEDESYEFEIGDDVYDELVVDVVRYMFTQRCGMELTSEQVGAVAHGECHTTEATIYGTSGKKDVSGGWHDAGDFGKYVVPGAQTAMDLMLCYENNKTLWSNDSMGIPESGNGTPDILDETRYELEFLLKMQDETTGGVYHKVTTKSFPGFIMPDDDKDELVLSPISTTATGDFAGVMAKASMVYASIDKNFSDECLAAAKKAYDYMEGNYGKGGFHNPSDISTGEYPDENDSDELYFAASMLYAATGDAKYKTQVDSIIAKSVPMGYGWVEMGAYGSMLLENNDAVKKAIIAEADKYIANAETDGYDCALGKDGYCWGSNLGVCNNARILMWASELTGDSKYSDLAYRQLDYLLGENSLSICFVTGYGSFYPDDTHHRTSSVEGSTVKGMLVGGPNGNLEDPYVQNVCKGLPVAKCYADNQQSYSTNEVTIYWNSPLAVLLTEIVK